MYDVRAGEEPDKINQKQCCNPKGEQHFFCSLFQGQKFELLCTPEKKAGKNQIDSGMIIKCPFKTKQEKRKQCPRHSATRAWDTEQIVKRAFIKEKKADCEQEQIEALSDNIVFLYPFFHMQTDDPSLLKYLLTVS